MRPSSSASWPGWTASGATRGRPRCATACARPRNSARGGARPRRATPASAPSARGARARRRRRGRSAASSLEQQHVAHPAEPSSDARAASRPSAPRRPATFHVPTRSSDDDDEAAAAGVASRDDNARRGGRARAARGFGGGWRLRRRRTTVVDQDGLVPVTGRPAARSFSFSLTTGRSIRTRGAAAAAQRSSCARGDRGRERVRTLSTAGGQRREHATRLAGARRRKSMASVSCGASSRTAVESPSSRSRVDRGRVSAAQRAAQRARR